jgi:hypothetical protein
MVAASPGSEATPQAPDQQEDSNPPLQTDPQGPNNDLSAEQVRPLHKRVGIEVVWIAGSAAVAVGVVEATNHHVQTQAEIPSTNVLHFLVSRVKISTYYTAWTCSYTHAKGYRHLMSPDGQVLETMWSGPSNAR